MSTIQPDMFIVRVIENLLPPKIEQECEKLGVCQSTYSQIQEFIENELGYCFPRFQSMLDEGNGVAVLTEEGSAELKFTPEDLAFCTTPSEGQKGLIRFNMKLAVKDAEGSEGGDATDAAVGADAAAGEAGFVPIELTLEDATYRGVEAVSDPSANPPVLPATKEAMEDVHACAVQQAYYGDWNLDGIDDLIIVAAGKCFSKTNNEVPGAQCMDLYVMMGMSSEKASSGDRFKYGECVEESSGGGGCSAAGGVGYRPPSSGPSVWDEAAEQYSYLWRSIFGW